MPDLSTFAIRVVECATCHQPISGSRETPLDKSPCAYCGVAKPPNPTQLRSGFDTTAPEPVYRSRPRDESGARLSFDLTNPPDDCASWARGVGSQDLPALRAKWET